EERSTADANKAAVAPGGDDQRRKDLHLDSRRRSCCHLQMIRAAIPSRHWQNVNRNNFTACNMNNRTNFQCVAWIGNINANPTKTSTMGLDGAFSKIKLSFTSHPVNRVHGGCIGSANVFNHAFRDKVVTDSLKIHSRHLQSVVYLQKCVMYSLKS